MRIVEQSFSIEAYPGYALEDIERAARTCYKSEGRIGPGTAEKMVRMLVNNNHLAMLNHVSATVRFITNRGVSHEIVRHRLAAYAQESTRYCCYANDKFDNEVSFIKPHYWEDKDKFNHWKQSMERAEADYLHGVSKLGMTAQEARDMLPNSLKTEVVMTADFTEWRHVFALRCAKKKAHPDMVNLMRPCFDEFVRRWPAAFDDLVF